MNRLVALVSLLLCLGGLSGCGTRFGHSMQQGVARVTTEPPALKYYIVAPPRLQGVVPIGSSDVPHAQGGASQRVLMTQVGDIANGSGFLHEVGTFALIVHCPQFYRVRLVSIPVGNSVLSVNCSA